LLNPKTINKILSLLENGFSWRKTAKLADVSVSTVQRIANGKRSNVGRSSPLLTSLVNSERCYFPLELRGETLRRYLEVRNKKLANPLNS
jgi:hypothetical protein